LALGLANLHKAAQPKLIRRILMKQIILLPLLLFSLTALAAPGAPGTVKWNLNTQEPPVGDMVAGPNNTIYLTTKTPTIPAHLWSINMVTGGENWAYQIDGNSSQVWEPDVDPTTGDVAVTGDDGESNSGSLYYISSQGTLLWTHAFSNITSICTGETGWPGKPAITNDGNIYVSFMNVCTNTDQQNVDSNVAVFNSSGTPLSYKLTGDRAYGTAIYGNVRPYAYSWLYKNQCFSTAHGAMASCSEAMGSGADVSGGTSIIGTFAYLFTGINILKDSEITGAQCLNQLTARCTSTTEVIASAPDDFYAGVQGGIYPIWQGTSTDLSYARPLLDSTGVIYSGGPNGYLYIINPDGTYKHEFLVNSSGIYHRVALDPDGTIYVTTGDGSIVALDGATGTIKWQMAINAKTAPLIGPDGTVYVDTAAGVVYAFNGEPRTKK
jgi:outer membrane protein assembly factor BamB